MFVYGIIDSDFQIVNYYVPGINAGEIVFPDNLEIFKE